MFRKGDRVKFLNDVGGGIVTRVENKIVYVENEDGFEVPSLVAQLLKVQETTPVVSPTPPVVETIVSDLGYIDLAEAPNKPNVDTSINILLAWTPQHKKDGKKAYDIHLVNDCTYHIMYVAAMIKGVLYRGIQAGTLESDTTIHLTEISQDDLKEVSSLHFDILFFKKGNYLPHEPMRYKLKIDEFYLTDPVNYVSNLYFEDKALIFNISQEYMIAEIENVASDLQTKFEKQKKLVDSPLPSLPKKTVENVAEEIDLHIDQLVDNSKSLTPVEMLDIQMERFSSALEGAIKNRKKRIIFIHGVGNGRLRLEIHRTLDKKYPKLKYQDASFKEYGFGATMVII